MLLIDHKPTSLVARCMRTLVISTVLVSTSANSAITKNSDIPIHFTKGAISSVVSGKLNPNDNERWYRFDATSGQYAVINKGGIVYQGYLPATGTYRLRVARNLMATEGKIAGYNVELMILPTYASHLLCK